MSPTPPKIKIKVRPHIPGAKPSNPASKTSADPVSTPQVDPVSKKRRKSIIGKVIEIIISDIKGLPSRIVHGKKVVKKVKLPDSNESWRDWEGEI